MKSSGLHLRINDNLNDMADNALEWGLKIA